MTVRGVLTPINRTGFHKSNDISVLRKASYEETEKVLLKAAAFSQIDELKGVTEKVILGQTIRGGTGLCQGMIDPEKVRSYVFKTETEKLDYIETDIKATPINTVQHNLSYSHYTSPYWDHSRSMLMSNPNLSPLTSPMHSHMTPNYTVNPSRSVSYRYQSPSYGQSVNHPVSPMYQVGGKIPYLNLAHKQE